MLKWFILGFVMSCQSLAGAQQAGFSAGSQFTATPIDGQVNVTCNYSESSAPGNVQFSCRDVVLEPTLYDYFVGPQNTAANSVNLSVSHEDGAVRTKSSDYDGQNGKSADAFNLWISTLFQHPLLALGVNNISWSLSGTGSQNYEKGTFQVTVVHGEPRHCAASTYSSANSQDCNSQYTVCQHYFEQMNNCK